jgi:MFS family permease
VGALVHAFTLTQSLQLFNQTLYLHSFLPTKADVGINYVDTTDFLVHNVSVLYIGEILGVFLSSPLCDTLGRRLSLFLASIATLVALVVYVLCSSTIPTLYSLKFVLGIPIGIQFHSAMVYIAEISTFTQRGQLLACISASLCLGSLLAYTVQSAINQSAYETDSDLNRWWFCFWWKLFAIGIPGLPLVLQVWTVMFLPETPRWLLANRTPTDCSNALQHYRRSTDVKKEFSEMYRALSSDARLGDSWLELLVSKSIKLRMILGLALPLFTSFFSGIGGLSIFFAEELLVSVGFSNNYLVCGCVWCLWMLACLATYRSFSLLDKSNAVPLGGPGEQSCCGMQIIGGRRAQMLLGALGMTVGWLLLYLSMNSDAWVLSTWNFYHTPPPDNTVHNNGTFVVPDYNITKNNDDFIPAIIDMINQTISNNDHNIQAEQRLLASVSDVAAFDGGNMSLFLSTSVTRWGFYVGLAILVYYFFFSVGSVQWVYIAEMYPYRARAKLVACSTACHLIGMLWSVHAWKYGLLVGALNSQTTSSSYSILFFMHWICSSGWLSARPLFQCVIIIFAVGCIIWLVVVWCYYPETKRLMLEDMEVLFRVENHAYWLGCCPMSQTAAHTASRSHSSHSLSHHPSVSGGFCNQVSMSLQSLQQFTSNICGCTLLWETYIEGNSVPHSPAPRHQRDIEEVPLTFLERIHTSCTDCWYAGWSNGYRTIPFDGLSTATAGTDSHLTHIRALTAMSSNNLLSSQAAEISLPVASASQTLQTSGGSNPLGNWWKHCSSGWLGQRNVSAHVFARMHPFPVTSVHPPMPSSSLKQGQVAGVIYPHGQINNVSNGHSSNLAQPAASGTGIYSTISSLFSPPYFPMSTSIIDAHTTPITHRNQMHSSHYGAIELMTPTRSIREEKYEHMDTLGEDNGEDQDEEIVIYEPNQLHKYSREMQETKFHHVKIIPSSTPTTLTKTNVKLSMVPHTPMTAQNPISFFTSPPPTQGMRPFYQQYDSESNNYSTYFAEKRGLPFNHDEQTYGTLFGEGQLSAEKQSSHSQLNRHLATPWQKWQAAQEEEDEEFFGDGDYGDPEVHDFVSTTR